MTTNRNQKPAAGAAGTGATGTATKSTAPSVPENSEQVKSSADWTLWQKSFDAALEHCPDPDVKATLQAGATETMRQHLAGASTGWQWQTLADTNDRPPKIWLVDGMFRLPSLSVVFGASGDLKSMLLADLAVCVAAGIPWLAGLPNSENVAAMGVKQAATLWVDCDNGADTTKERFFALKQTHHVDDDAQLYFTCFPQPPFIADDPQTTRHLHTMARSVDARLIILDNLGTISGGADENSVQMVQVMYGLRNLAEQTGAAVVVIHHRRKSSTDRLGDNLRGHTSIEAALDLAMMVQAGDDDYGDHAISVRPTKQRFTHIKSFRALWTYQNDTNGDLVQSRFFGLGEDTRDQTKTKFARACDAIRDVLTDNPGLSQSALVESVQAIDDALGINMTRNAIARLEQDSEIENRGGGTKGRAHEYYLFSTNGKHAEPVELAL